MQTSYSLAYVQVSTLFVASTCGFLFGTRPSSPLQYTRMLTAPQVPSSTSLSSAISGSTAYRPRSLWIQTDHMCRKSGILSKPRKVCNHFPHAGATSDCVYSRASPFDDARPLLHARARVHFSDDLFLYRVRVFFLLLRVTKSHVNRSAAHRILPSGAF